MSLGPLMVDIAGTELSPEDVEVLSHPLVGSVLLFTRNYRDPGQVAALTATIRELRTPHLMIAVDHEGGRVQRFRDHFTRLPASRPLGRRFDEGRGDDACCERFELVIELFIRAALRRRLLHAGGGAFRSPQYNRFVGAGDRIIGDRVGLDEDLGDIRSVRIKFERGLLDRILVL